MKRSVMAILMVVCWGIMPGNVRAVVNGATGAVEQSLAYYPYGGVIADLGTGHSFQPYKFGEKELTTANGLIEYDFGARRYYQAAPMFTGPDPMAEKYPWLSPYLYCASDPVNLVDPDGREWHITSYRDEENKLHIKMNLTGVLYNDARINIDMESLASSIKTQIDDVFTFGEGNFDVTMNANIRVANEIEEINETDHVFAIVKNDLLDPNDPTCLASTDTNGLLIKIGTKLAHAVNANRNLRSVAHELGHSGGLDDNDPKILDKDNNLMMQAMYLKPGTYNQATNIEVWQLNKIIKNYNKKNLNLRTPLRNRRYNFIYSNQILKLK